MNLFHLKAFYYTAKYRSYTKAAKALYVTQPAITRQIQELQNTYNLVFFNKIGKKIMLTDAGEAMYSLAEKIFDLETQVEESIRDFQYQTKGNISIASCETLASYYLPYVLAEFSKKFPDIFLSVRTHTDEEVLDNVLSLDSDIGFVSCGVSRPKLTIREFLHEDLIFIASPDNPLARKKLLEPWDLNGVPVIWHEPGCGTRRIFNDFIHKYHLHTKDVCEFTNNSAIINLVKLNVGISLISRNVVHDELKNGEIAALNIAGEEFSRIYYIAYHQDKYFSKIMADFVTSADRWVFDYLHG
ncbi:MAG: LysR family transcriptional regulator [Spirochaetia bacterium]|nr:LysR family transcriptional regulator [Spirochaetia bacterium]